MAKTQVRSEQITDGTVRRDDLNVSTPGQAVCTKIVAGTGVTISSTGVDSGTGDVTVNATLSASFATPAIVLGSAAAIGAASTVIRSDATIAAFDATNPSTQAFGDAAVVGSVAFAARRDHKHAMMANPLSGQVAFSGAVTDSTATGNLIDVAITNSVYRWNGASGANFTGIAGGTEGRIVVVENIGGAFGLIFRNERAESVAANRILTPDANDWTLFGGSVMLIYDATVSRWRLLSNGLSSDTVVPVTQAFGDAASAGSFGYALAHYNHRHGMPANPLSGQIVFSAVSIASTTTGNITALSITNTRWGS